MYVDISLAVTLIFDQNYYIFSSENYTFKFLVESEYQIQNLVWI